MRVVLLRAWMPDETSLDEQDARVQADAVRHALVSLGHEVFDLEVGLDLAAAREALAQVGPDLVFNLVESLDGVGRFLPLVATLVEQLGIPMTGASADALYLSSNKLVSKTMLRAAGLPTPDWVTEADLAASRSLPEGKLIVKSVWEHASIGLDQGAVLVPADGAELASVFRARRAQLGGEAFAERFIPGREWNLALLGGREQPWVFPAAEIQFRDWPDGVEQIVDYRAKWVEDSAEYQSTVRSLTRDPADIALVRELESLARRAWAALGVTGYARVDFRVDEAGLPWILEVNANPCISPDAGFAAAAATAGVALREVVAELVGEALARSGPGFSAPGSLRRPAPSVSRRAGAVEGLRFRSEVSPSDPAAVERVVRATGFFSEEEVGIAVELVEERINKGLESGYYFLFGEVDGVVESYACFGPVPATAATWDLYWIASHPNTQGKGVGKAVLGEVAGAVRALGGVTLIAETSGRAQYAPTRAFYRATGFYHAANFPDFYATGDDRVVYGLAL